MVVTLQDPTVRIEKKTQALLDERKASPSQSYNDVIAQLLKIAPDDIWTKKSEEKAGDGDGKQEENKTCW